MKGTVFGQLKKFYSPTIGNFDAPERSIIIRFWRCRIWRLGKRRLSGLSCLSRFARETVFRKVWRIQEAGAARIPPLSSSLNYSTRGGRCCAASCVVGLRRSLRRPCGTLPSVAPPSLPPCPPSTPCIQHRPLVTNSS